MTGKLETLLSPDDYTTSGKNAEELEKVRESALKILDHADNTSGDLSRKLLNKGYGREEVEIVIDQLANADLLNDVRFAEQYTRNKTEAGKGPLWIRRKLLEKGIDREIVEQALKDVSGKKSERRMCLIKALDLYGLKYDYQVDDQGNLKTVEGIICEQGIEKVFERNVRNESNRVDIYKEREKEKARLIRRLASSGFSQDAVLFAVRRIGDL